MNRKYLIILITLFSNFAFSQSWDWAETFAATQDVFSFGVAADDTQVVAVGWVSSSTTFGTGTNSEIPAGFGGEDAFIAKYNLDGSLAWVKRIGSAQNDRALSVAIDTKGDIFVSGQFCGTMEIDAITLTSIGSTSGTCVSSYFILKLDSNGTASWAKAVGSVDQGSRATAITLDNQDNVYVTGDVGGIVNIGPSTIGVAGKTAGFLAKYGNFGNEIWAVDFKDDFNSLGLAVATSESGKVAVTGEYKRNVVIGGTTFPGNSPTWGDYFVASYNSDGSFLWASTGNGTYRDQGNGLAFDNADNLYVTGAFSNELVIPTGTLQSVGTGTTAATSNGGRDIFLIKYNSAGQIAWANQFGNTGLQLSYDLFLKDNKEIILSSASAGDLKLGNDLIQSEGVLDILLTGFDTDGNYIWSKNTGGIDNDYCTSFTMTSDGFGYATGYFRRAIDFDGDMVSSRARSDGFLARLFPRVDVTINVDSSIICENSRNDFSVTTPESGIQFLWEFDGGNPSTSRATNPSILYDVPGMYDVRLTIVGPNDSTKKVFENYVVVKENPSINLGNDSIVCPGDFFPITFGQAFSEYLWSNGNNTNTITTDQNINYWLEVTDEFGCKDRDSIEIAFQPQPDIGLGEDTTVCIGATIILGSDLTFENYSWSNGSSNPEITVFSNGSYQLTVTDQLDCMWSDTIVVDYEVCTSVEDKMNSNEVTLYPNPTSDKVSLEIHSNLLNKDLEFEVIDIFGRRVISKRKVINKSEVVDFSTLQAGIYFIQFTIEKGYFIKKVVLQ